jgi:hypothetical protein
MTPHTFHITAPADSTHPGYAPVVQVTIAINLGAGAHDPAHGDDLVSDTEEFTSLPSAAHANGAANAIPSNPDHV